MQIDLTRQNTFLEKFESKSVLISGPRSWIGLNLLRLLAPYISRGLVSVDTISRNVEPIKGVSGLRTKYSWANPPLDKTYEFFFHFASPHKPNLDLYREFRQEVASLNELTVRLLEQNSFETIFFSSSGAAEKYGGFLGTDSLNNPYGFSKLHFEHLLKEECEKTGSNLSICRIYSISGAYCPRPKDFALSSMILDYFNNRRISIKSPFPILRQYIDVTDLLQTWAFVSEKSKFTNVNSGGDLVDLVSLKNSIYDYFGQPSETSDTLLDTPGADSYFNSSNTLREQILPISWNFKTLKEQIECTVQGLMN